MRFLLIIICVFGFNFLKSQTSYKNTLVSDLLGTYSLKTNDEVIVKDHMIFYSKDGKITCKRVSECYLENKKQIVSLNYDILYLNLKKQKITLAYKNHKATYKIRKNSSNNLEIIVYDDVLIYEKQ